MTHMPRSAFATGRAVTAPLLLAAFLSACATMPMPKFGAGKGPDTAAIEAAVANPARPAKDVEGDAGRKPAEILAFLGARTGMSAMDVNAGGGYYTELLSYVAGADGKVVLFNDDIYGAFAAEGVAKRTEGGRLGNVVVVNAPLTATGLDSDSVDAALMSMAYHDWYFTPENRPEPVDVPAALLELKRVLKPGGVFVIIDHSAKPGSPPETGNTLHRIDPALVKTQMAGAGFEFVGELDVLRNPDDTLDAGVFDETIRGKTDRFVLKYKKPKG